VTPRLLVAKDKGELRRMAAELLAKEIRAAVLARGVCSLALSGGSTPGPVYDELGNSDLSATLPWPQLEIYFADERAVPADHAESNYKLAKDTLLRSHPEMLGRMFRMPADAPDRDQAAQRYAQLLPDPLDVLVLGLGPDGHTASLFPGSAAIAETERRVLAVTAPKPPPQRMTITPPVIRSARVVVVIAAGAEKASVLARALDEAEDPQAIPGRLARHATWIVDQAAAGPLGRP
jgi:6-phosphogluconolactonase